MKKLSFFLIALLFAGVAGAQCVADLRAVSAPTGNSVLGYSFINWSTTGPSFAGKQVTSSLDFGDGSSATMYSNYLHHNYAAPGTYIAQLTITVFDSVTNAVICTDVNADTFVVSHLPCAFTIASTKVNDSTYTLTATNATANPLASFTWSFGDGTTGSGSPVTHSFPRTGYYYVSAKDTFNGCGYQNGMSLPVTFQGRFDCDSVQAWMAPWVTARTVNMSRGINPSFNYPGTVVDFQFDYGDGSAATASTSHAYSATGTYTVKGFVTTRDSITSGVLCRDTLTSAVSISYLYSNIDGRVLYDSLTYGSASGVKVYLIKHDTAAGMLSAVDSISMSASGYMWFQFQNVPAGRYLVKAAWPATTGGGTGIVPTYSDSSLVWSSARPYNHDGVNNTGYVNIWMRTGTTTSGPGFVGGLVSMGANKGTSSGAPGVSMILQDVRGNLIAMTETDSKGQYAFRNVPTGSYIVMPELLNYDAMASSPLVITNDAPTVTDLHFTKDDSKMSIRGAALRIPTSQLPSVSVSPNPARGFVRIVADAKATGAMPVELRDLAGKTLLNTSIPAGGTILLDVQQYPAGLYFLHAGSGAAVKLVIQ